jgi:predicted acylesterase/phospholipase RssA
MTGASASDDGPRRSLILAGGGLKVAFQAGVLQVWLDEAGDRDGRPLRFDHADGCSGGVFNLAMWCQGMTGRQIADNWRRTSPLRGLSLNWTRWLPLPDSLFTYDRFRRNVLQGTWGLDWDRIRATQRMATFNLYDFSAQEHRVVPPGAMDEDALVSAVSLPVWFPPVARAGARYIDAVFATDANLTEAIARGADELWIIWTVSQSGRWGRGPVNQYFQMIEAIANSRLRADLGRIARNNDRVPHGDAEFGRHIDVHCLAGEVPAHYLFNFTRASMAEAVDQGVATARAWCDQRGLPVAPQPQPPAAGGPPRRLSFRETMSGTFAFGTADPRAGAQIGETLGNRLSFTLRVSIDDLDAFLADGEHRTRATGTVTSPALGGTLAVSDGRVDLLASNGDPRRKRMTYRLHVEDALGTPITLLGQKEVVHDRDGDLWSDTTTLFVELFRGRHEQRPPGDEDLVGSGVLRLSPLSFARQLTTFRAGPGVGGGVRALAGFGSFFGRQLWQAYSGPADAAPAAVGAQYLGPAVPT